MNDPFANPRPWWEDDYVWRPKEADATEDAPAPEQHRLPEPLPNLVDCWRCGKSVEEGTPDCPYCRARLRSGDARGRTQSRSRPAAAGNEHPDRLRHFPALGLLLAFFGGLLLVSLVQGLILLGLFKDNNLTPDTVERANQITAGIDTLLVLLALAFIPRPPPSPKVSGEGRVLAWVGSVPVLAALLGLNFLYHWILQGALGIDRDIGAGLSFSVPLFLLMCVWPAIVEEVFFRYLALGTLRRYMGLHAAVLVSSLMFGMAHVGQPFSIPVLTVVGMGLGYMRVASRGLALPMLMHFAHNLVVLLLASA